MSPVFDHKRTDGRSDDMRATHVSDAKHKLIFAVTLADDRQTTENDRMCTLLRPRQLGEYESSH